ncbi:pterin dehydratase [Pilimelia columellifera]|uniref:4a-hydroxytetrahydrobiopterin dehydratase n=1 Tax=Pilimelia columellifera subsp. columellifera TaxID=706583 RepID=A0ABP6ADP9_9ACTN
MRVSWRAGRRPDYLSEALALLSGWRSDGPLLRRDLTLSDSEHAALTERIQVAADALQVRPQVRRTAGQTVIKLDARHDDGRGPTPSLTPNAVAFAARIEHAYRAVLDNP